MQLILWRSQEIRDARLGNPNARSESARRRYEEGKKGLRRPDGYKLYSDEAHGEEFEKLARERDGVLAEVSARPGRRNSLRRRR